MKGSYYKLVDFLLHWGIHLYSIYRIATMKKKNANGINLHINYNDASMHLTCCEDAMDGDGK